MKTKHKFFIGSLTILILSVYYFYQGNLLNHSFSNNIRTQMDSPDPVGLSEWRSVMRNHNANPSKVAQVRKEVREMISRTKESKDAGLGDWEELGPTQVGGRVRAIAIHPTNTNIIFVGGVSGGIWKSTDGGNSWTAKSDFNPSLAVTSILIKPSNPDIMFASTGEGILAIANRNGKQRQIISGSGVMWSKDGGETWDLIPAITDANIDNFYWVNKIVFDPNDDSKFFAGTSDQDENGIGTGGSVWQFSNDGGTVDLSYNLSSFGGVYDLDLHASHDTVFVGNSAGGLMLERNPGMAIMSLASTVNNTNGFAQFPGRVEFSIAPSNPNIVYALCQGNLIDFGFLYRSTDNGQNWTRMDMIDNATSLGVNVFRNGGGGNQGWYNNTLWVDPLNANRLVIGGINLWRTNNGGDLFIKISDSNNYNYGQGTSPHADHHIIIEAPDYTSANRKVYFGSDGGIAKADNINATTTSSGWDLINNNLSITQFYASDIRDNGSYIAGAQDNGTSIFTGGSWSKQAGSDGGHCAFGPIDTVYFSFQNGAFRMENATGGIEVLHNLVNNPEFIAPMKVFPFNKRRILLADEKLWHTDNPQNANVVGPYFTDVSPAAQVTGITIMAIEIGNTGKVVVGYEDGRIYRANFASSNNPTWTQIDGGLFAGKVITDIAISPFNSNKIAVSIGGYDDDNIYMTFNNGNTWVPRSNGLPGVHTNTLLWHYDTDNWLYAGTDLGVFATEDNGTNWNVTPNLASISDGPVFTEITNLQWGSFSAGSNKAPLYATSYGRGIWRTSENVVSDLWLDQNHSTTFEFGVQAAPFKDFQNLIDRQAHGQTWYIDHFGYPVNSGGVVIDKRVGELQVTNNLIDATTAQINSVILGEN